MNGFKKSDLKTGYILTFSDGLKGIVIKDKNGSWKVKPVMKK